MAGQNNPLDMLMYYDARPCAMNGIFDMYTYRPLKGYFTIYSYANIYELGTEAYSECEDEDVMMLWQNSPCVVVGKNQNIRAEVDISAASERISMLLKLQRCRFSSVLSARISSAQAVRSSTASTEALSSALI